MKQLLFLLLCLATPGVAFAAGDADGFDWKTMLFQGINLLILIGALVYFARKPAQNFFAERRSGVKRSLDDASKLLSDAEEKLSTWQQRAAQLDSEVEQIRATTRELAGAERDRILADAERQADRIRRDAGTAVDRELKRAQDTLRAEAAQLATELAERMLRNEITEADRDRLVSEFVQRIESTAKGVH